MNKRGSLEIVAVQILGGDSSCIKYFGAQVSRKDQCTVKIIGKANFSSSYDGTIFVSVRYERRSVEDAQKTYEYFENLTINNGFEKTYSSDKCKADTSQQLIVTEFTLRDKNLPDYNGCTVKADLLNGAP